MPRSALPDYITMAEPSFVWGDVDGPQAIWSCYDEVVHWKRNLFKIPTGKTDTACVRELALLFNSYMYITYTLY